ncbi:Na+/H+ antiporter subunit D, partial [Actinotignum timonense]|nr:Na+/H+ antiporter subunit D [Actinotignum timonense]
TPLLAAGLSLVLGRFRRAQLFVTVIALAGSLAAAIAMAFEADTAPMVLDVGSWAAPVGVSLVADRLTLMMLIVSLIVT